MADNASVANVEISVGPPNSTDPTPLRAIFNSTVTVESTRNLPDCAVVRFPDPEFNVVKRAKAEIGGALRIFVKTNEANGTIFEGDITAILSEKLESGAHYTEFRSMDRAHRLMRGSFTKAYPNQSIADVVKDVIKRTPGIKEGKIDDAPKLAGKENTQVSQVNESNWEFLTRLAAMVGAQFNVGPDATLDFVIPQPPEAETASATPADSNKPFILDVHSAKVRSLRAVLTSAGQVPSVEVRSWDPVAQKAVSVTKAPEAINVKPAAAGGEKPVSMAEAVGAPPLTLIARSEHDSAAAQVLADSYAARIAEGAKELYGVSKPDPRLLGGVSVTLVNAGETFDGSYVITSVTHRFGRGGHDRTEFTVTGRSDRSLAALTGGSTGSQSGRINGLVPGVVDDTRDPAKQGRVRVRLDWLGEGFVSDWARVVQMGAGNGRGLLMLPEKDDEVLVAFEHGHVDSPYVIGGLFHANASLASKDGKDVDDAGQRPVRSITGRSGARLAFVEGNTNKVVMATSDDKSQVILDEDGTKVTVDSKGVVHISGKKGVTIDAGGNKLTLKGGDVAIEGSTSVAMNGGDVSMEAKGSMSIESQQLSANGSAMTEIKGGTVFIN